jgi:hypothetical protein|tara:strand:+ start:176 stop:961 length:786 start_codon:yes stop_codon:yes gene_type:complete
MFEIFFLKLLLGAFIDESSSSYDPYIARKVRRAEVDTFVKLNPERVLSIPGIVLANLDFKNEKVAIYKHAVPPSFSINNPNKYKANEDDQIAKISSMIEEGISIYEIYAEINRAASTLTKLINKSEWEFGIFGNGKLGYVHSDGRFIEQNFSNLYGAYFVVNKFFNQKYKLGIRFPFLLMDSFNNEELTLEIVDEDLLWKTKITNDTNLVKGGYLLTNKVKLENFSDKTIRLSSKNLGTVEFSPLEDTMKNYEFMILHRMR